MTEQKRLKALIRARMARTGESYTSARSHIVKPDARPSLTPVVEFRAHDKHCMTAVFTPDNAHLISGGFGGQARIWTVDGTLSGELIGHEAAVSVVRISPDGATVVTAASDKTVRVWDLATKRQRFVLGRHRKQVLALDLDAPRDRVWSGDHDGRLNAWSLATQELVATFDLGGSVRSVAVRPGDGAVAAATFGAGIAILSPDGAEVARLAGDQQASGSVAWAADGTFLLASYPGGATVWVSDGWEAVRSLDSGPGSMLPAALTPTAAASRWDGTTISVSGARTNRSPTCRSRTCQRASTGWRSRTTAACWPPRRPTDAFASGRSASLVESVEPEEADVVAGPVVDRQVGHDLTDHAAELVAVAGAG